MTPAEAEALGRRYLAAGGKWRPGMLVLTEPESDPEERDLDSGMTTTAGEGARLVAVRGGVTLAWETGAGEAEGGMLLRGDVPDLRDPATVGCVLAEVLGIAWGGGNLPPMWDDILDAAKAAGRENERAAIVAWLRMCGIMGDWPDLEPYHNPQDAGREAARIYADEIERGAHYDER